MGLNNSLKLTISYITFYSRVEYLSQDPFLCELRLFTEVRREMWPCLLLTPTSIAVILPLHASSHHAGASHRNVWVPMQRKLFMSTPLGQRAPQLPSPRKGRYIPEAEMETHVQNTARELGFDEQQAVKLGACGRNIYSMGCGYHPTTVTTLEQVCGRASEQAWAVLLLRCMSGAMPRLRSEFTASARMAAARASQQQSCRTQTKKPTPTPRPG